MRREFTLRQRIRYRFDNTLSRGIWGVLLWLAALSAAFFLVVAAVIRVSGIGPGDEETTFFEGVWLAITRSLDPGTFSGDEGLRFRLIMLAVTLAGIFLAATIIGLVSAGIDSRVESLRRGKSLVVETGHTVIIGHSDKLPTVIGELVEANRSERGRAIVVLTPDDTVHVTEEITAVVPDMGTSRLVVRSGQPTRTHNLAQVNPADATSVIVLGTGEDSDAQVVKVVLALATLVPRLEGLSVVAEIDDVGTGEALRAAVGPSLVTVTPDEVIARIAARVSRSAGLGAIYQELLDFDGDEMYTTLVPKDWVGRSFGEALLGSSRSSIVGIRRGGEEATLCPPVTTVLAEGDHLVGIAEDDSTFRLDREPVPWERRDERQWAGADKGVERTLLIGWSPLAPLIAREIDEHVAPGSALHVMVDPVRHDTELIPGAIPVAAQTVVLHEGDPISRTDIGRVIDAGPFDHIMLLCERETFAMDEADARVLLTLMHVREATAASGGRENLVAELLDPNDVELSGEPRANSDFIVSQRLISLLLGQLSESPQLAPVFADLFDSAGAVVEMHPVERYLPFGEHTFADIVVATRAWGVVAIGYACTSTDAAGRSLAPGVRVNPPKDQKVVLSERDRLVVITRD